MSKHKSTRALDVTNQNYAALWPCWAKPRALFVGQEIRVFRWQTARHNNDEKGYAGPGHVENGVIDEIRVQAGGVVYTVAAIDLRQATDLGHGRRGRPPVGIRMRGNLYWMGEYVIEERVPYTCNWPADLQGAAPNSAGDTPAIGEASDE